MNIESKFILGPARLPGQQALACFQVKPREPPARPARHIQMSISSSLLGAMIQAHDASRGL